MKVTYSFLSLSFLALLGCETGPEKTKVNLNNKVVGKLPIEFHPLQPYAKLSPGESTQVVYRFVNISPEPIKINVKAITSNEVQIMDGFDEIELNEKQAKDLVLTFRISSKNAQSDLSLNLEASSDSKTKN